MCIYNNYNVCVCILTCANTHITDLVLALVSATGTCIGYMHVHVYTYCSVPVGITRVELPIAVYVVCMWFSIFLFSSLFRTVGRFCSSTQ